MIVAPAIFTADYNIFAKQFNLVSNQTKLLQLDVADGSFVSAQTFSLREISDGFLEKIVWEAHLMVENPEKYLQDCLRLRASRVIAHIEALNKPEDFVKQVHQRGMAAGLALNPETEVEKTVPYLSEVDSVLIMGVSPGRQGQLFLPAVLEKISQIRSLNQKVIIGIDGGIKEGNIEKVAEYRPDYLAIGSGLWESDDPKKQISYLSSKISVY